MRYLLDEMYPASAAEAARTDGIDVFAVQGVPVIQGLADADLFAVAQLDRRVLVTENARDLLPIEAAWRRDRGPHRGLVLSSNRSFPRHNIARFLREFAAALVALDGELDSADRSFVRWLQASA